MKITAWRIAKRKHAKDAFSGKGARLFGGRWNSPGIAMVYTAQSRALAALEMLVHLESAELLEKYVLFEVGIDKRLVTTVDRAQLPRNWKAEPPPARLKAIGDSWVDQQTSAVLQVLSALVEGEHNFLINPHHPDFQKLFIGKPVAYRFDPRLKSR